MAYKRRKPRPRFVCKRCGTNRVWKEWAVCPKCQGAAVRPFPKSGTDMDIPF